MAFFNTILLLKLNIRTHHVNSFPPFFNYISEGFLCLISLVGAALQRCLHRPPSPHLLFFLSVISVSPTPSTGVESRTSHTLSYILSFVFRTGSHKVNLASLRFALYPRLALTSCSPFFRLPSSCQPVCLLLVLKDLFPLSNKLLLRTSTVLLSLASVARGTPLILSHGPASYCSSLHTKGVLGKLTLTLSSCWQPVLPPVSPCSAILCLVCPLPSEPCAVTLHNFLQPGKRNPREESYEAGSLTTYLRVLFTHWKKKKSLPDWPSNRNLLRFQARHHSWPTFPHFYFLKDWFLNCCLCIEGVWPPCGHLLNSHSLFFMHVCVLHACLLAPLELELGHHAGGRNYPWFSLDPTW